MTVPQFATNQQLLKYWKLTILQTASNVRSWVPNLYSCSQPPSFRKGNGEGDIKNCYKTIRMHPCQLDPMQEASAKLRSVSSSCPFTQRSSSLVSQSMIISQSLLLREAPGLTSPKASKNMQQQGEASASASSERSQLSCHEFSSFHSYHSQHPHPFTGIGFGIQ